MTGSLPYLALLLWVPLAVVAFTVLAPNRAAMLVMLGGMLFLPEGAFFDAPAVPPLGKHEVASICALVGLLIRSPRRLRLPRLVRGADLLLLAAAVSGTVTIFLNRDWLSYGPVMLPAMRPRDMLAFGLRNVLDVLLPYLVGRMCIQSMRDARALVGVMLGLGLLYSLLILFELRFSPNLHRWIYGYHARADFSQTIRWGGYRPTVFMEHGLAVALFATVVALFAAVQARLRRRQWGLPSWCWTLYFAIIMIFCRSAGAMILGAIALAAILWISPRKQLWLAAGVAAICLIYPCLRLTGFFPKDALINFSRSAISADRAASLQVRFDNEELLMEHARERPWFGWGAYGRNRLYDAQGNNAVITDGYWIILLSVGGVTVLYGLFGTMLVSVFSALRLVRKVQERGDQQLLAGLALVTVCYVFDLLPNGMFNRAPLFFAGALTSLCAAVRLGTGPGPAAAPVAATWVLVTPIERAKVPPAVDS
jgi:hypothetical protein